MTFPCVRCGLCCRRLKTVPALEEFDRGDGVCRHLKNNLCAIYANRPTICNVAMMYELYFKDTISENQFIQKNLEACRKIAEEEEMRMTYA